MWVSVDALAGSFREACAWREVQLQLMRAATRCMATVLLSQDGSRLHRFTAGKCATKRTWLLKWHTADPSVNDRVVPGSGTASPQACDSQCEAFSQLSGLPSDTTPLCSGMPCTWKAFPEHADGSTGSEEPGSRALDNVLFAVWLRYAHHLKRVSICLRDMLGWKCNPPDKQCSHGLCQLQTQVRGVLAANAPLPTGCTPHGVGAVALALLRALPEPLIPKHVIKKLSVASQERVLRPQNGLVPRYVGKCAMDELRGEHESGQAGATGSSDRRVGVFELLKGIVAVLVRLAEYGDVRSFPLSPLKSLIKVL